MITAGLARRLAVFPFVGAFAISPAVWASKQTEPPRVDSNLEDPAKEVAGGADAVDLFATRQWTFEGHLGIATPVGSLGGIVEYAPLPFLGFGAGAGLGSGPVDGNHFHGALVGRARPIRGTMNALVIEGAYSFGGFAHFEIFTGDAPNDWSVAGANWTHWAQTDLGWEHRWDRGLLLRLSLGAAWLLDRSDVTCPSVHCGGLASGPLFTFDTAIGYTL